MARRAEISGRMNLDSSGVNKALKGTQARIKRFASGATAQIARIGAAFLGVGLVKNIIRLGTAAEETANKFNAVFKDAASDLNLEIEKLKESIPATTTELRESLATLGQMARAFGLNDSAANMFSVEMIKLTGDLASFNNMRFEEAFVKIRSAISGEFEPMKQLGIVINEARLKQEGLNTGVWDGVGALSAAQKALIVQNILIQDMGEANGDAAKTSESAANQIKFMMTKLRGLGEEIGQTALPGILKFTEAVGELLKVTVDTAEAAGTMAGEFTFGDNEAQARGLATRQLKDEGAISEELPRGFGSRKKRRERGRLIDERTALILKKEKAKETKEETKAASELNDEIEETNELGADPKPNQAMLERIAMYQMLIDLAGQLNGIKSNSIALSKAEREAEKLHKQGDSNKDGIITGREKRAKEREDRKKETEMRRRRRDAVAAETYASSNARAQRTAQNMTMREKANGLMGTVPMQGPSPVQPSGNAGKKKDKQEEMNGHLKSIDETIGVLKAKLGGN